MTEKDTDLKFALEVARKAGSVAMDYFEHGFSSSMKSDNTPVTEADKDCERIIRQAITETYPFDNILGEEEGETIRSVRNSDSTGGSGNVNRKWIIDPIDGTYNYARKIPVFATLLALEENDEIVLGIMHAPAMGDTFWASKGGGAYKNGQQISVSTTSNLKDAHFLFGEPDRIIEKGLQPGLDRVIAKTYRQRAFCDYLNFAFVFEGKAEAALEVGVKPWDLAPMKILVEEAGGRFSDLQGGASIYHGHCLVSNGHLHDELLQMLSIC